MDISNATSHQERQDAEALYRLFETLLETLIEEKK
jgi:hypothetical protein